MQGTQHFYNQFIVLFLVWCAISRFPLLAQAQEPLPQDCLGAIPVCQEVYSEPDPYAYSGEGNYLHEIEDYQQCITPELSGVWYVFTVQSSGMLRFTITPNDVMDDFDWIVFDLTHHSCGNLPAQTEQLMVSSNNWGAFDENGDTGANSTMSGGGAGNCNGPGEDNGPPWNDDIPVTAGNTYVLYISNWSNTQNAYTLDFTESSAQIYDNQPPEIANINTIDCGASEVTFRFSENVLCETVEAEDFELSGPEDFTITGISSPVCESGAEYGREFTLSFSPPVMSVADLQLTLNPEASNSVEDVCGNLALEQSQSVFINSLLLSVFMDIEQIECAGNETGKITVTVAGGGAGYTYSIDGGQTFQNNNVFDNLPAGTYQLVVMDTGGCASDTFEVVITAPESIEDIEIETTDLNCFGDESGAINISATGGEGTIRYSIDGGQTFQNNGDFTGLDAGTYTIVLSDNSNCPLEEGQVELIQPTEIQIKPTAISHVHCYGDANGRIEIEVSGGETASNYTLEWSNGETSEQLNGLSGGAYTATVTDAIDCTVSRTFNIDEPKELLADVEVASIDCENPDYGFINFQLRGGTEPYFVLWQSEDGSLVSDLSRLQPGWYSFEVTDAHNCSISGGGYEIQYYDCWSKLNVPNVFTPDNDGINDYFVVDYKDIGFYALKITNRWGQVVFESNQPAEQWNGCFENKNSELAEGVYFYVIDAMGLDSIPYRLRGSLHLFRSE